MLDPPSFPSFPWRSRAHGNAKTARRDRDISARSRRSRGSRGEGVIVRARGYLYNLYPSLQNDGNDGNEGGPPPSPVAIRAFPSDPRPHGNDGNEAGGGAA